MRLLLAHVTFRTTLAPYFGLAVSWSNPAPWAHPARLGACPPRLLRWCHMRHARTTSHLACSSTPSVGLCSPAHASTSIAAAHFRARHHVQHARERPAGVIARCGRRGGGRRDRACARGGQRPLGLDASGGRARVPHAKRCAVLGAGDARGGGRLARARMCGARASSRGTARMHGARAARKRDLDP